MLERLRQLLTDARKKGDQKALAILQVVLGEISQKNFNKDEQIENLIRGIRDRNSETLKLIADKPAYESNRVTLRQENELLSSLLPQTLTVEEIVGMLTVIFSEIKAVSKEGAAVGMAMKFLKSKDAKVLGDDVKKAVEKIRSV